MAFHNLGTIPEGRTFDTKKIAKSKLKLPSYSLEVMANFFGLEGKYHHSGLDMWFDCRDGDRPAQREMVHYCNVDVIKTKDVLLKLLPYMKQVNDFVNRSDIMCPNALCLSHRMIKAKKRRVFNGFKQQYQCKDCGTYWTNPKTFT